MQRHFCVLLFTACSLWAMVVTLFVAACSSGSGGNEEQSEGAVKLVLGKLQVPLLDSISVHVSATGMKDLHLSANFANDNVKIEGIPLGENRKFEVKVYADGGKEVLTGEANAHIVAGQTATIPIALTALSGFLRIEVPLGLANSENIHSGVLHLDSLVFQMQIETGKGVFATGALPLNRTFNLNLRLMNIGGDTLFLGQDSIILTSISQTKTIQLRSTRGSAILALEASSSEPTQILAMLPKSTSRPPLYYGDLFFTEIFADPKTNGNDFEYMEIYNATLDTLELSKCRIAQTINSNSTAVTQRFSMPEDLILLPMKFLYFGRDSVMGTDFKYKSFTLSNTGQSLGFFCESTISTVSTIIDTLSYSNTGENKFPLSQGNTMQLPLSNFANRTSGSSWCTSPDPSPKQDANCQ